MSGSGGSAAPALCHLAGREMVKQAPAPGPVLAAVMVLPCALTRARAIVRPMPEPPRGVAGGVGAVEPLEEVRQVIGRDAVARVGDRDPHPAVS